MLTDIDMGRIFAEMQAAYGYQWAHDNNAMQVWKRELNQFRTADVFTGVNKAVKAYTDFPPSLGQLIDLVKASNSTPALPAPSSGGPRVDTDRVYAYTRPQHKVSNPKGNPHFVTLPDGIAQQRSGEDPAQYEKRIGMAVTLAMYPNLQSRH